MGRKRANAVYEYYEYNTAQNKSVCLIGNCSHEVTGNHGTNVLSHLSSTHPDEFTSVMFRNKKRKQEETCATTSSCINISNKEKVVHECASLVTIHGRPFSLINDRAFQNILKMIPSISNASISSQDVRNYVVNKADKFRKHLGKKLKNRLLSIKVDSATCMDRTFIGINVQYIDDEKIYLNTLAVKETYIRHTALNILTILKKVLSDYDISVQQIYSITTDNGSNMIKLGELIANDQVNEEVNETNESDSENSNSLAIGELNENYSSQDVEFTISSDTNEEDKYQVRSVRCAAHTLQLAVTDVLKDEAVAAIICQAREVCKKLRTPIIKSLLKAMSKKKPIIDCPTRWHSTLDMLERLLHLKECCDEQNKDYYLHPQTWLEIDAIVQSLIPSRVATKLLQEEQLFVGDFYKIWTQCALKTGRINTPLAKKLVEAMRIREINLFDNDCFLAGLFLDVRFTVVLSQEQVVRAMNHLVRVWEHKEKLFEYRGVGCSNNTLNESNTMEDEVDDGDDFEKLLRELDNKTRDDDNAIHTIDIISILQKCRNFPRLNSKENILEFWNKQKNNNYELYSLAQIVLAVPPTQASVERLFSSLKYILSPLRYNLSDDILNDILVIRCNKL